MRSKWGWLMAATLAIPGAGHTESKPEAPSALPGFAKPTGRVLSHGELGIISRDLVRYRRLTREDFRAPRPPLHVAGHEDRLGAVTCALISPLANARVEVRKLPTGEFGTRVLDLGFEAWMDRECSWWNDAHVGHSPEYVLEHEQIHFALFELEARRLNAEAAAMALRLGATGPSQQAVMATYTDSLRRELEVAARRVIERSLEFDEDTSNSHRPDRQRAWRERVSRELGEPLR